MKNVIELIPQSNIPQCLRNIADQFEKGEFDADSITVIISNEIMSIGSTNDNQALGNTCFDLIRAFTKLGLIGNGYSCE